MIMSNQSQNERKPVRIFGFGEECDKCVSAREKIEGIFGLEVEEHSYEYHAEEHSGWRDDGSVEVLAARSMYGEDSVPLIQLPGEDFVRSYPNAMKRLKELKKQS